MLHVLWSSSEGRVGGPAGPLGVLTVPGQRVRMAGKASIIKEFRRFRALVIFRRFRTFRRFKIQD